MKKEVMNTNDVAVKAEVETTIVEEIGATNAHLKTLIEEICVAEEFSILRETLRLYCEEINIH